MKEFADLLVSEQGKTVRHSHWHPGLGKAC
jgi:hypothetical protein